MDHASILVNLLAITCSIKSLSEERFDPAVGKGVTDKNCRAKLTVEIGSADWHIGLVITGRVI